MHKTEDFKIDCTGDICVGDTIQFTEAVFGGTYSRWSRGRSLPIGERTIIAEVIKDSYGELKQQHTFTLRLLKVTGDYAKEVREAAEKRGGKIMRKGRNIYRNGTKRLPRNEKERRASLEEKYQRGNSARASRQARKEGYPLWQ